MPASEPSDHQLTLLSLHGKIGLWWVSAAQEFKFAGSLEIDGDLILLRMLRESQSPNLQFEIGGTQTSTFHGLVDGRAVTLIQCLVTHTNTSSRNDIEYSTRITVRPELVLIGERHANPHEKYSMVGFSTNEVHKVFRVHPLLQINPTHDIENAALTANASISVEKFSQSKYALVELPNLNCFHSNIEDINGSISYQFSASHSFDRERGPSATYAPRLVMELEKPVSLYRLLRYARQSTHLMSLISITPNYCLDINVSQDATYPENWKLFQNGKPRTRMPSELCDWQVLIRFPEHSRLYPELWGRWFETRNDHAVPRWIFQSSLEQGYRFDINRFLNVMQCLEILAKIYADGALLDKTEFEKFCDIVETEASRHSNSEKFVLVARLLRQQNRPPLATRLRALISRLDGDIARWLLGDNLEALDLAVKARNYFTHFGDLSPSKRELVERNLGLLTCKMSALYVILELDILGMHPSAYLSEDRFGLPWMLRQATEVHIQ